MMPPGPVKIFYSYSRFGKDELLREELDKHLSSLERQGIIKEWHVGDIEAGAVSLNEINNYIDNADIILLLMSADFISSDECNNMITRALERQRSGGVRVIPVLLRPCLWNVDHLQNFIPLPKNGMPVTMWENLDEAFLKIVEGLLEVIEDISGLPISDLVQDAPRAERETADLPFLCDREDQDDNLLLALEQHKETLPRRPFLCIVHGNKEESPEKFKDRMCERFLPWYLELGRDRAVIPDKELSPRSRNISKPQMLNILRQYLAGKFQRPRTASLEEIAAAISAKQSPVLVYTHLGTEYWHDRGTETAETFFEFWQQFPDLSEGSLLIVCLILTHRKDTEQHISNKVAAVRYLESLDFSKNEKLSGKVLPELSPVAEEDVERWIRNEEYFEDFCDNHSPGFCRVDIFIEKLGEEVFQGVERIPMVLLAKKLSGLLDAYGCKG
jgi:hypothetical protein